MAGVWNWNFKILSPYLTLENLGDVTSGTQVQLLSLNPPWIVLQRCSMPSTNQLLIYRKAGFPGVEVKLTTPLFCVPKWDQPGKWHVITDCQVGRATLVYLNRPLHILEQMYTGGYSAMVVPASISTNTAPTNPTGPTLV